MLIGAIGDRQLVLSIRKRQSRSPKVYDAISATVRLAWNEPAPGRVDYIRCPEVGNELDIMVANRRIIDECSKRRDEIRSSRKQPEELCR
jgi:hypothetical protein